ncbi:MAG TPA: dTDP-4-dehydrorhamnose 3,5-epimerase [Gemmatimonadaceae bacterium]|nr:dTDP-4-dehydrorhamnose 3,5-epimerase [Gemmatimonadaceae bacterium]
MTSTEIPDLRVIEPRVFGDGRGSFSESFRVERFAAAGLPSIFVQDNVSVSARGVVRGLHFQHPRGQHKLVHVVFGEVMDVAVDIRRGSATYGRWAATCLSDRNHRQLLVPPGFAHGFAVTSEQAIVVYKCSDYYAPEAEHCIRWDDDELAIAWPVIEPIVSMKDQAAPLLRDLPAEHLPVFSG